jgi:Heterokaryon incompatibility protein (HET)
MVREMIRECVDDHVECRSALEDPNFLPTRLLSVGSSTRPHLKLVTTAKTQVPDARYLALSHSWGNMTKEEKMKMTTTTATLPSRHARISEKSLSKTFQEFIYVARTLDVPYVWMDSLCIIQESAEDWNREVAMMAKVYSHSLCTIAADASADGHGGL